MIRLALPLLLLVGACAHKDIEPRIVIQKVDMPVASPCVPKELGPVPVYVDSGNALREATDAAVRYQLVILGRAQRDARLREIEPIIASCPKEK